MSRRLGTVPPFVCALALGALLLGVAPLRIHAQARAAGAVSLLLLVGDEQNASASGEAEVDYGAGAIADLYFQTGVLRVGGALGLAAVSSPDGLRSRVYMPLAASISALLPLGASVGLDLRVRAGLWAGATDVGLEADFFGSAGGWLTFAIGAGASVTFGLDVLLQRAELADSQHTLATYFAPGLGLVWSPPAEPTDDALRAGED